MAHEGCAADLQSLITFVDINAASQYVGLPLR
jgi:hypothetical protein